LLKKKPLNDPSEKKELEVPSSPILVGTESLDPEFNSQLSAVVKDPSSHFGYAYTGRGYITQETFWFYSCVMMTCVNTVKRIFFFSS
jgi:hypothetical protein